MVWVVLNSDVCLHASVMYTYLPLKISSRQNDKMKHSTFFLKNEMENNIKMIFCCFEVKLLKSWNAFFLIIFIWHIIKQLIVISNRVVVVVVVQRVCVSKQKGLFYHRYCRLYARERANPKMTSSACTSDNLWYYYYSVCQTNFEEINRTKYIDAIGREVIKRTGTTRLLLLTVQCWRLSVCYFFQRPSHHHHSHKLIFKAQLCTILPNKNILRTVPWLWVCFNASIKM